MKNFLKIIGIITIVAIIGFSLVACGNDDNDNGNTNTNSDSSDSGDGSGNGDGSGDGDGDGSGFLGAKLELSEQVYEVEIDYEGGEITYKKYTGEDLTIKASGEWYISGGTGEVKNGILSFSIGTPAYSEEITEETEFTSIAILDDFLGAGSYYGNISHSEEDVKCFFFYFFEIDDDSYIAKINESFENTPHIQNIQESVLYVYVEKDVTVSGTKVNIEEDERNTSWSCNEFSLELKAGWNAVYQKFHSTYDKPDHMNAEITVSLGDPDLKWVLWEND